MKTSLRGNAIRPKGGMMRAALLALTLVGCAESHALPSDAGRRAPDMGGCLGLSATLRDGGPPIAHVYPYPDGHPCGDGGGVSLRFPWLTDAGRAAVEGAKP
jgi:hypothetical protein